MLCRGLHLPCVVTPPASSSQLFYLHMRKGAMLTQASTNKNELLLVCISRCVTFVFTSQVSFLGAELCKAVVQVPDTLCKTTPPEMD